MLVIVGVGCPAWSHACSRISNDCSTSTALSSLDLLISNRMLQGKNYGYLPAQFIQKVVARVDQRAMAAEQAAIRTGRAFPSDY